jgi:hypothetical protein
MTRLLTVTAIVALTLAQAAAGQTPAWRFRWQPGQVLTYRADQVTTAAEVLEGKRTESTTKMRVTKRWQVLAVDAQGVATVQKVVVALRLETTTPGGETLFFDSAEPDKSNAEMREQLGKFVGQPLEVLRVDGQGRVVEVKESKHGAASRFESDLPFVLALPDAAPQAGQGWQRTYHITLEPPQGTGEKYEAAQHYTVKAVNGALATVGLTTALKTMPDSLLDRVPLLQMQPEGDVVFDVQNGLLRSARLRVDKDLVGHQGEGSSYKFQSVYTEEYVEGR